MNKVSKIIISALVTTIMAILIVSNLLMNSSMATEVKNCKTVNDLMDCTLNDSWFKFDPSSGVIGKSVSIPAFTNKIGGYCVDPHNRVYGGTYQIVNVIDINNGASNTVKVYGKNKNGSTITKEYDFSNENIKPYLMLAYLSEKGKNEAALPVNYMATSYKAAMPGVLLKETYLKQMLKVGLSDYLIPTTYYEYNETAWVKLGEARIAAEKMAKQGSTATAVMTNKTNKDNLTTYTHDGKFFVGPYKLGLTNGCKVGEITVNGTKAAGISTDGKTVKGIETVADEKEFYIVLNKEIDEIKTINVTGKDQISTTKARLLFVSGGASQNFMVYKATNTQEKPSTTLPAPTFAKLQIVKVDEIKNSNLNLKDIGFVVWSQSKKAYVIVKNGKIEYVDFATAKKNEFKTDKDGKTQVISNLAPGKYEIYETSIPKTLQDFYKLPEMTLKDKDNKTVKTTAKQVKAADGKSYVHALKSGQTAKVTAKNYRDFVPDFRIQKVDKNTGAPLKGIEFRLYGTIDGKEGWITTDKNNKVTGTTVEGNKAAKFVTGTDGWTPKITKIPVGSYRIYETGLGEYENIYEDLQPIRINGGNTGVLGVYKGTYKVEANKDNKFTVKIDNTQVYINISGFVWQDIPTFDENKNENMIDNIYGSEDYKIDGIEVRLMDKTTNKVATNKDGQELKTLTSNGGKYKFENIKFQEKQQDGSYKNILGNYYVEFTYDGVTYQNVITPSEVTDTSKISKAQETKRQEFNNIFTEITGEGQVLNGVTLTYTKKDGRVYSNNIAQRDVNVDKKLVNISKAGDFTLGATTADKYLLTTYNKLSDSGKKVITEIPNVNLGLYMRPQSVISLEKDISSAKLSINGFNHIYTYGTKTKEYQTRREQDFNVGVQFKYDQIVEGFAEYSTPVYRSDYNYTSSDKSKELKVSIIYKIELTNDSINKTLAKNDKNLIERKLTTKVNSVVDYFDKKYENIEIGTGLDEATGTIKDKLTYTIDSSYNDPKYAKAIINTNIDIERGSDNAKAIYVKFDLSKENVGMLLDSDNELLENTAEVNSYTVKEGDKLYAAFDMYSIPANANPNKQEEYENDTDRAPGLKLAPQDDRTMSGVVFEDDAISGGAGQERLGNGQYDNGETTIPGVKVKLVETDKDGNVKADGKVYEAAQDTLEDGVFNISGYVPGYYKVIYTWGDNGTYNVKDYKGTIFLDRDTSKMDWYKNENRYSDAMDDYQLRLAIDNNVTTTYSDLTKMNSSTPIFGIGVEYGAGTPGDNITTISTGDSFVRCDVSTMDFGIIQRPHQTMDIDKHVTALKVTDTAGKTLVDAIVNSEGKLEGKYDSAISGVTGGKDLGFFKVEMDNELIQDSTAEVEYEITVKNTSEIDYDSEAYYLYGRRDENELNIKLKATGVYDYLFGSNSDGNKNNSIWNSVPVDVIKTLDISKVQDRTVLDYIANNLTKELSPTEEVSERFFSNKPLTTSGEISLENSTEIKSMETTSTSGTTGGEGTTRLGIRREPQVQFSKLFAEAERVTVTPPTGGNKDYTTVIIISIAAIAILGTGIILIKKKVLSK